MHGTTPLIHAAVRRGGILSFHLSPLRDHRALYIDLDEHSLFKDSSTDPTAPSHRLLRLRNPEQCARYLALLNQYLTSHNVFTCLSLMADLAPPEHPLETITSVYKSINRDITAALLNAEKRSACASYGYPWSPTLMRCGQNYLFWKKRCSDCVRFGDALASVSSPSSSLQHPDMDTLLTHRDDLPYLTTCLKASRLQLDEYQAQSKAHRTAHLEERALYAAQQSDSNAEIALNNILKAEEVRCGTFQKLRKYAKGQTYSTLQRVEIPNYPDGTPTGSTTSISNPAKLFAAILNQNQSHFSQATPSP